ncbi:MAG: hypothetical protein ACR2OA_01450 [Rubripirellula sp.]
MNRPAGITATDAVAGRGTTCGEAITSVLLAMLQRSVLETRSYSKHGNTGRLSVFTLEQVH